MARYFFEDFAVGDEWDYEPWTPDEEGIRSFAERHDPQPMHTDPGSAAAATYGGVIASGWQTALSCMTPFLGDVMREAAGLASPGFEVFQWLKPVRPGASIRPRVTVLAARRSRSRPGVGVLRFRFEGVDEGGGPVWRAEGVFLISCRRPG